MKPRSGEILLAVGVSPRNPETSLQTKAAQRRHRERCSMSPFQGLKRYTTCVHIPWADAHG